MRRLCREAGKGFEKGIRPTAGTALILSGRPALNSSAARRHASLSARSLLKPGQGSGSGGHPKGLQCAHHKRKGYAPYHSNSARSVLTCPPHGGGTQVRASSQAGAEDKAESHLLRNALPSAQTRRAPAAPPLAEALMPIQEPRPVSGLWLVEPALGPTPLRRAPAGGAAAAVAGPEAASPARCARGGAGGSGGAGGGGGDDGSWGRGPVSARCGRLSVPGLDPCRLRAGQAGPQPRGQVNLLHLPGAWAIGGPSAARRILPADFPAVALRPLAPVRSSRPQGGRLGSWPAPHTGARGRSPGTSRPSGAARALPRRTLAPGPRARRPRSGPLRSARPLPGAAGTRRSGSRPWPSGLGPEGVGSPRAARCGAAGLRGRWAGMRPPGETPRRGPGLRPGGKPLLSRCAGSRAMAISSWFSLCKESSLVESRVLNY